MLSADSPPSGRHIRRRHLAALLLFGLVILLLLIFDWNWLKGPLQSYVTKKTGREFSVSSMDVDFGWTPTIKLKDVRFANADWAAEKRPMASIGTLEFSVSLRDLIDQKILVPRAALGDADLVFEKSKDAKKNWVLQEASDSREPSKFRIGSISVDRGTLRYIDHAEPFDLSISVSTFAPEAKEKVKDAEAAADNRRFTTKYSFKGRYHEAPFKGEALTGDVLSFQQTDIPFPLKGSLDAGSTRIHIDGSIADVADISGIDVQLKAEGDTLASLYPFLLLPLPASPPYVLEGRLIKKAVTYSINDLVGKIGSTDIKGRGEYLEREPRPLLTIDLRSKLLKIADLGPIIGLETKDSKKSGVSHGTRPTASETGNRPAAQKKERETAGDKTLPSGTSARKGDGILPSGKFEGGRLRAIDADVTYRADSLKAPAALPVESMRFKFSLHDAVANLNPLEFGFAGGAIVGRVMMDARDEKRLVSTLDVDFRRLKLAQITPDSKLLAQGGGTLGGTVRLKAVGNSIADAAGNADGQLAAAIANGRISNLADAAAGLNGGKVLALLAGGDKNIKVNCGAIAFAVKDGLGSSEMITMDTEQTVVEGQGAFSLKDEKFDVRVEAKPKRPGILSLRTPIHAFGSFRSPEFELEKTPLLARGGAALALAAINPLASVIALLEPGTDDIASCQNPSSSVAAAQRQAQGSTTPKR